MFSGCSVWLKRSFDEKRFDRERGEKFVDVAYLDDGFGAVSGEEAGVWIFGDTGAGDQIAAA